MIGRGSADTWRVSAHPYRFGMTWREPLADSRRQRGWNLLGAAIRRRRHSLQWTQRVLEAESGIDQTVISRIENGKQYGLRWVRFAELVDALGGLDARGFDASPPSPRPRYAAPEPRPRIDLIDGSDVPIGDDESCGDDNEADQPDQPI
jgi:transcriptional regulator with XRE-family HTH domain